MSSLPRRPLLERLALHRPELRAWALYDWANSAMYTVIITAVFPIFFADVAAAHLPDEEATRIFSFVSMLSMLVAALLAPFLGSIADYSGIKKRLLALFMLLGVLSTSGMFWLQHGQLVAASVLFGLANVGAIGSFVFYDALLPHVAREGELDRLSTSGYALGYVGGGLLLALDLAWILRPGWFGLPSGPDLSGAEATLPVRLAFLSVGLWWVVFSIPLLRRVPEPPRALESDETIGQGPVRVAFQRLGETFRELRRYRQALLFLLAFFAYNDGIGTIIRMATIYGRELGLARGALIGAILMVQFVGIPFAFAFGALAQRIGAKRSVVLSIGVYFVITLLAWRMTTELEFFLLAFLVGTVQGGSQALSRSLFASMIPRHKSGEFFGLFAVLEKFAGILGPLAFGLAATWTGSSRVGLGSVIVFFGLGLVLLLRVDVEAGQRAAREADLGVRPVPP